MKKVLVAVSEDGRDLLGGRGTILKSEAQQFYSNATADVLFLPYKTCVGSGKKFLIPVELEVEGYDSIESRILDLDLSVVQQALLDERATAVLYCLKEGWVTDDTLQVLEEFIKNMGLPYSSFLVVTSTYILSPENRVPKVKVITYPFFEVESWTFSYAPGHERMLDFRESLQVRETLQQIGFVRPYRILMYDRQPKPCRVFLHLYFRSLKSPDVRFWLSRGVEDSNILEKKDVIDLIKHYSDIPQFTAVKNNLDLEGPVLRELKYALNQERNPVRFVKETALLGTINVLSETWFDIPNVFFSEKIYKAIAGLHAIVLVGQYKALSFLRKQGYKTFSRYWNESYDSEVVPSYRLSKICETIQQVLALEDSTFLEIVQDMQEILIHNHDNLMNASRRVWQELQAGILENYRYSRVGLQLEV